MSKQVWTPYPCTNAGGANDVLVLSCDNTANECNKTTLEFWNFGYVKYL